MHTDCVQPFLFEHLDIRGALVSLDQAWHDLSDGRDYAPAVARVLGEMSAVTALIAANLKQPGRMTFQLRGDGVVNLLVLDCDEQLRLRGLARGEVDADTDTLPVRLLLGNGQLLLTLDDLGSFPLGYGTYLPQPDSRILVTGIRSLIGFGNLVGPLAHSVLYLRRNSSEAIPQYISGRTSYIPA